MAMSWQRQFSYVQLSHCCGQGRFGSLGSLQEILKEVELPIVDQKECQTVLRGTRLGRSEYLMHNAHCTLTCKLHTAHLPVNCTLHNTGFLSWIPPSCAQEENKVTTLLCNKLRFILRCKNECQPIFLKTIHLITLRKNVTCKAPD